MQLRPWFTDTSILVVSWRIALLLAAALAEGWNIVNMVRLGERASEHFAYFTVQTNIAVMVVLAWMLLVRPEHRPRWFDHLRGAVTAYAVLTGIVYALLVAQPGEVWSWDVSFSNATQHRFVPIVMGLDWLLVSTHRRIRIRDAGWWMLYPAAYLVCAMLRGGLVDSWFPYPFLDPAEQGGWGGIVLPVGQVLLAFLVGILVVAAVGRWRYRDPASLAASPSSTSSSPHSNSSP